MGDNKGSVSSQSSAKQQNHEAESFTRERSRSFTKTPKGVPVGPQSLVNGHTVVVIYVQWTRKPTERGSEARTLTGSGGTAHSATTAASHGRVNSTSVHIPKPQTGRS